MESDEEHKGWAIVQLTTHLTLREGWRALSDPWTDLAQTTYERGRPNSLALFSSVEEAQEAYLYLGPSTFPEGANAQIVPVVDNRPPEQRLASPNPNPMAS
jgi:hypothetical protein